MDSAGQDTHEEDDFDLPLSPMSGTIRGLEALQADTLSQGRGHSRRSSGDSSMLHITIPGLRTPADIALSAMQYLPYPLIILNNLKTVVLCNEAMGRLLDPEEQMDKAPDDDGDILDKLQGQTLSQIGIDMVQDARPVWVSWDSFLDEVADEGFLNGPVGAMEGASDQEGDVTPTVEKADQSHFERRPSAVRSLVRDAVVEVLVSILPLGDTVRAAAAYLSSLARWTCQVT